MPLKKEERIQALEHSVGVLMELYAQRKVRLKDSDTQTERNERRAFSTQTTTGTTAGVGVQTEFRKNITERGIQIAPHMVDAMTNTDQQRPDPIGHSVETQTEKVISIADIFMKKVNTRIMPQLSNVENSWIINETNNRTFGDKNILGAFQRIKNRQFNTGDVVDAIHACIQMILVTYADDAGESEYETDDDSCACGNPNCVGEHAKQNTNIMGRQNTPAAGNMYLKIRQGF